MMVRSTFCCIAALIGFASCSTISFIDVETRNPAEITFPEHVKKVLIVNNALPQPEQSGYMYNYLDADQDTCRAYADSALVYACRMLGDAILDSDYFGDVLLYNEPFRTDNNFLAEQKLSPAQVTELCRETGADAVISLDRLLFAMQKNIKYNADRSLSGEIKVQTQGIVRCHIPGRSTALATVHMNDSVEWAESAYDAEILNMFLPLPDDALSIAGIHFGGTIYPYFVPYWTSDTRWFYTSMSASWKEATAYVRSGKWEEAARRWEQIHNKAKKWGEKARSASNLALACEMSGKFDEACRWAEKSLTLWQANTKEDDSDRRLVAAYAQALNERVQLNRKLDQQIGAE